MTPPGPTQLLIILLVVVLLFGAKKLPDLARSVGRSSRILKSELSAEDQEKQDRERRELPEADGTGAPTPDRQASSSRDDIR
ncbi:twin-arginine translocase TatA/TatE family subunit [Pseudonocardia nematodicida]|uniref:Sec-independent protein translocase protein TatA n=1 Tax=Pseudonocardia nematodicida TaxID=1206997 RepID=A0ABV1KG28_9PSEU